jgi:hypothetical protein
MGQKEIENEKKKEIAKETDATNEKDNHMIEILKKENEILKKQLESLNTGKENNYDTLLSMLEVLSMQRKKILSIKNGNL